MTTPPLVPRRERRTAVAGSVALLAALGAGAVLLQTSAGSPAASAARTGALVEDPAPATAPATARSVTAALVTTVVEVAGGTASDAEGFHEQAGSSRAHDALDDAAERDSYSGSITFTPGDGSGGAVVRAVLSDAGGLDHNQRTAEENFAECSPVEEDCAVTTLPDGSLLRTSTTRGLASNGRAEDAVTLTASRLVGDAVVSVSATNHAAGLSIAGSKVTRPGPVLTLDQLTQVVSQPWWGYDLPRELAEADLASYEETDSVID